jgi:hypothetical protein
MTRISSFNRILLCLLLSLATGACSTLETSKELPRKQVTDVNLQGYKDTTGVKKRVMVLPFLDANEARDPVLRENARRAFIQDLNRTGQLIAIDSQELHLDLSKHIQHGEYVMKDITKETAQLGINSVLEGKIIDLKVKRASDQIGLIRNMTTKFESVVRVRVYSSRGSRELMNIIKTVVLDEPNTRVAERVEADKFVQNNPELVQIIIKDAFMDFTPQVIAAMDKIVWEGRIAAISGDRVYLNVGRISGLQTGDILKVSEEGEDVFDPDSGSHIGKVPGRMKGTLEIVSYFGTDGAVAVIHSGSGFKENDKVEMY